MSGWQAASQPAVERMRKSRPDMPIEIEAQSLAQVDEALDAGADTILLDNLSLEQIREAVEQVGGRAHDGDFRRRDCSSACRSSHRPAPTSSRSAR